MWTAEAPVAGTAARSRAAGALYSRVPGHSLALEVMWGPLGWCLCGVPEGRVLRGRPHRGPWPRPPSCASRRPTSSCSFAWPLRGARAGEPGARLSQRQRAARTAQPRPPAESITEFTRQEGTCERRARPATRSGARTDEGRPADLVVSVVVALACLSRDLGLDLVVDCACLPRAHRPDFVINPVIHAARPPRRPCGWAPARHRVILVDREVGVRRGGTLRLHVANAASRHKRRVSSRRVRVRVQPGSQAIVHTHLSLPLARRRLGHDRRLRTRRNGRRRLRLRSSGRRRCPLRHRHRRPPRRRHSHRRPSRRLRPLRLLRLRPLRRRRLRPLRRRRRRPLRHRRLRPLRRRRCLRRDGRGRGRRRLRRDWRSSGGLRLRLRLRLRRELLLGRPHAPLVGGHLHAPLSDLYGARAHASPARASVSAGGRCAQSNFVRGRSCHRIHRTGYVRAARTAHNALGRTHR